MVSAQEALTLFLEENPELYVIMKSKTLIEILKKLSMKAKQFNELLLDLKIEEKDLITALNLLIEINVVKKIKITDKNAYFLTQKGKEFIKKYSETKEEFFG